MIIFRKILFTSSNIKYSKTTRGWISMMWQLDFYGFRAHDFYLTVMWFCRLVFLISVWIFPNASIIKRNQCFWSLQTISRDREKLTCERDSSRLKQVLSNLLLRERTKVSNVWTMTRNWPTLINLRLWWIFNPVMKHHLRTKVIDDKYRRDSQIVGDKEVTKPSLSLLLVIIQHGLVRHRHRNWLFTNKNERKQPCTCTFWFYCC